MAYREDISVRDLEKVRGVFAKLSKPNNYGEIAPCNGFGIADNCLELLADVKHLLKEQEPKFAKWRSWGPAYYHDISCWAIKITPYGTSPASAET
jgi:hypothetical protein